MRSEFERRLAVLVEPLERAALDGVCEFEGEPDRVRVELGIVPVFLDERPLLGLGGLIDWRSSGRLSAVLRSGFFKGAAGEQLLMPGERRWPIDRLVLLGLGARADFDERRARELGARGVEIAAGLAATRVLLALPAEGIPRSLVEVAFDALLEAIGRAAIEQAHELAGREATDAGADAQAAGSGAERGAEFGGEGVDEGRAKPDAEAVEAARVGARAGDEAPSEAGPRAREAELDRPGEAAALGQGGGAGAPPNGPEGDVEGPPVDQSALQSQAQDELSAATSRVEPRWWVVVNEAVVARLRRVRSGPPRAARGGPSLHT